MAGFIVLCSGKSWSVANWAFRQFIQDVIAHYGADRELVAKLQICEYHQGVHFKRIDPPLGNRILLAIKDVAARTVCGEAGIGLGESSDPERRRMYVDAVRQLLSEIHDEPSSRSATGSD